MESARRGAHRFHRNSERLRDCVAYFVCLLTPEVDCSCSLRCPLRVAGYATLMRAPAMVFYMHEKSVESTSHCGTLGFVRWPTENAAIRPPQRTQKVLDGLKSRTTRSSLYPRHCHVGKPFTPGRVRRPRQSSRQRKPIQETSWFAS